MVTANLKTTMNELMDPVIQSGNKLGAYDTHDIETMRDHVFKGNATKDQVIAFFRLLRNEKLTTQEKLDLGGLYEEAPSA